MDVVESTADDEIIVYGQLSDPSTSAVRFVVSRLLPPPLEHKRRPPRPDDPLPRRTSLPPHSFILLTITAGPMPIIASPGRKGPKRLLSLTSSTADFDRLRKKGKIILPSSDPSHPRLFARAKTIGSLPFRSGTLLRRSTSISISGMEEDDVFKVPEPVAPKKPPEPTHAHSPTPISELETTNKHVCHAWMFTKM